MTAREYTAVPLPAALDTARIRERLTAAALRAGVRAFETRERRLHALGVVGVVDIGEVIVEILPKTYNPSMAAGSSFLGDLLQFAGAPDDLGLSEAGIAGERGDLLEVIFAWTSRLAAGLLREGVPRRYAILEETSTAVRGRIELRRLVRQRPGRAFELTVRHAPLSDDNPMSRIIRWLLTAIAERTRSLRTRALCLELLHQLSGVAPITPGLRDLDRLDLTTMEAPWSPFLALARAFLIQDRPDPSRGGATSAVAVLFPLQGLFELALRRVFREGLEACGLRLTPAGDALLKAAGSGRDLIGLRPDFPLGQAGRIQLVGDAKWKKIFSGDGLPRPEERDIYQLTTYVAALKAEAGFLISPLPDSSSEDLRCAAFRLRGLERPLILIGIRLPALIAPNMAGRELRGALCDVVRALTPKSTAAV